MNRLAFPSARAGTAPSGVVVPAVGSTGDPTLGGGALTLYRGDGGSDLVDLPLPAARWTRVGTTTNPTYRYRDI